MTMTKEISLKTLRKLSALGFNELWDLPHDDQEGASTIYVGPIETATKKNTLDLAVGETKSSGATGVAEMVLQKINRKDPVKSWSDTRSEPEVMVPVPNPRTIAYSQESIRHDKTQNSLTAEKSLRQQLTSNLKSDSRCCRPRIKSSDTEVPTLIPRAGQSDKANRTKSSAKSKKATLRLKDCRTEEHKIRLRKYFCELTVDTNTVNRNLKLSDNNKKVTCVTEEQPYPDHPDRFDIYLQLLCSNGLTGRCYWEVKWGGWVEVSVSYRGISRRGASDDCRFGFNDQSWILECSQYVGYSAQHNNRRANVCSPSPVSGKVAVYVDSPAGNVSFYEVSSDKLIHLHTFSATFTEPLYPGFGLLFPDSSVSLCFMQEVESH